eukprot:2371739-Amphidinium_carterae.1
MRCGTPLRLMLKMCEILKCVWETLWQPSVNAERTRRCQTRKCWHLSLMTNFWLSEELDGLDAEEDTFGMQKVEDGDTVSLSTECLQEDLCSSLEDCWMEQLSSSGELRPLAFQAGGLETRR